MHIKIEKATGKMAFEVKSLMGHVLLNLHVPDKAFFSSFFRRP